MGESLSFAAQICAHFVAVASVRFDAAQCVCALLLFLMVDVLSSCKSPAQSIDALAAARATGDRCAGAGCGCRCARLQNVRPAIGRYATGGPSAAAFAAQFKRHGEKEMPPRRSNSWGKPLRYAQTISNRAGITPKRCGRAASANWRCKTAARRSPNRPTMQRWPCVPAKCNSTLDCWTMPKPWRIRCSTRTPMTAAPGRCAAECIAASGQARSGIRPISGAPEFHRDDRELLYDTAEIYRQLNRPQRALSTLIAVRDTYGPGEEPQQVLYLQGLAFQALNRSSDAADAFALALEHGAPSPELLYRLGEQFRRGTSKRLNGPWSRHSALDPRHAPSQALREQLQVALRPIGASSPINCRRRASASGSRIA